MQIDDITAVRRIEDISAKLGLKLNKSKCGLKIIGREKILPSMTVIDDIPIKNEITYLRAHICNNGGSGKEIRRRIGMAKPALEKLAKIWKE